jgi:hypothetical protein
VFVFGAFFSVLTRAAASVGSGDELPDLANAAEVIVLGTITSTNQVGVTTLQDKVGASRVMAAKLHAEEILKGELDTADITVRFLLPDLPIGYRTPPLSVSALFFLDRANGEYRFAMPSRPSIVGMPGTLLEGTPLVDRLATCVGAVIESPVTSWDEKREAIFALWRTPGAVSTRALQYASSLDQPVLALSAVAALLHRNDISRLELAAEAVLSPGEWPSYDVRQDLISGIGWLKDARAIPTLTAMLRQGGGRVRRAVTRALVNTGAPGALDSLAEALDDRDQEVRYNDVIGLAGITGQREWRPLDYNFKADEERYLSRWKEWKRGC